MPRAAHGQMGLEHLRAWRVRRGLSQADLSKRAEVTKATISALENGRGTANWLTVAKLADGLGLTSEQLLHEAPGQPTVSPLAEPSGM